MLKGLESRWTLLSMVTRLYSLSLLQLLSSVSSFSPSLITITSAESSSAPRHTRENSEVSNADGQQLGTHLLSNLA